MATRQPTQAAVKIARRQKISGEIDYLTLSFSALEQEVAAWADKLRAAGVSRGDRVLVMVRQGLPLIAAAFGLFKIGAIPIIIDPGMGRKTFWPASLAPNRACCWAFLLPKSPAIFFAPRLRR